MKFSRALVVALANLGACAENEPTDQECTPLGDCQPTYAPTFENIHARTLVPKCGPQGSSCHASEGAQSGLRVTDIDDAFSGMSALGQSLDPDVCSPLLSRLKSSDPSVQMPPGQPISAGELCAISSWIDSGMPR